MEKSRDLSKGHLWLNTELLMCELKLYESRERTSRM